MDGWGIELVNRATGQVVASQTTHSVELNGSGSNGVDVSGAPVGPLDFGNYVLSSIRGFKFEDRDGDGVYRPPTIAPDNGTGTADLPVRDVPFVSEGGQRMVISDGLPAGSTLEGGVQLAVQTLAKIGRSEGGTLGGGSDTFGADLTLDLRGTGPLTGWRRTVPLSVDVELHNAPRTPGDPVQSFATDLFQLEGLLQGGRGGLDTLTGGSGDDLLVGGDTEFFRVRSSSVFWL